jgi:flagellar assembly factor FliW
MTQPQPAAADAVANPPTDHGGVNTIVTRFGELAVDPDKVIAFDEGLYGLEQHRQFLLTSVPGWPAFFKLLQAVDDPGLSLIVLPLDGGEGPIDSEDFTQACRALGYAPETTAVIGIVTMRDDSANQVFTVNLKAPLLIDSVRRCGRQHVFASEKYHLRHPLAADGQARD